MYKEGRKSAQSSESAGSNQLQARLSDTEPLQSAKYKLNTSYIIPKVIEQPETDLSTLSETRKREQDESRRYNAIDKIHNYFSDQCKFKRPKWSKSWFPMMNIVVACVDISCVSSFPALVANNGGVIFLFAYLIAMALFVFPYMYLEGIIGQYFQISMIGIWGICPLFKGLSVGAFATCFLLAAFNPTVTMWSAYMMVEGFKSIHSPLLSWANCNNDWNSCNCDGKSLNKECASVANQTDRNTNGPRNSAALEYFLAVILRMWKTKYTDPDVIKSVVDNGNGSLSYTLNSDEGLGYFILDSGVILACLFVVILMVCGSSQTITGYIYTFTSFFPLATLLLIFARGISLKGATHGMAKYMYPSESDISKLKDPRLWLLAAKSAFFSMSAGLGIHLGTASFNSIHHDVFGDIIGAIIIDTTTRILGCLSMFAFVGHAYFVKKQPLPDVYFGRSPYFPFTVFAEGVANVTGAGFFAFLYYLMIIFLVLDTSTIALQTIMHAMYEEYRRKYPDQSVSESIFLFATVGFTFSLSMLTVTRGGIWVTLFSTDYSFGYNYNAFPAIQAVAFSWFWGLENICNAVIRIYGKPPHVFFRIWWKFICPLILITFLVTHIEETNFEFKEDLGSKPPDSALPLAICMTYVSVSLFLLYTIFAFIRGLKHCCSLTLLMLLISPEYEHSKIKANVRKAKRLHWKHYLFLYSTEELQETSICQRIKGSISSIGRCFIWICEKKKARIRVAAATGQEGVTHVHHHHHHHTEDKGNEDHSKKARPSMWSILSEDAHHQSAENRDNDLDPVGTVAEEHSAEHPVAK